MTGASTTTIGKGETMTSTGMTGTVAGVPYLVVPPATGRADAPVVVAWHLQDAPRTEGAFAAAVPLAGFDAWRFYLGLPFSGSRALDPDEVMRRGYEDAVLNLHGPVNAQGADEFDAVLSALRVRFGLETGPLGLLGGSAGGGIALEVTARRDDVAAVVAVNPVVRLRAIVDMLGPRYGFVYPWGPESDAVADRVDYVARAEELAAPVRLIVGGSDDGPAVREPAAALAARMAAVGGTADLITIPDMAHALAAEPGVEPAPQNAHAAAVDAHAVAWFSAHLAARSPSPEPW